MALETIHTARHRITGNIHLISSLDVRMEHPDYEVLSLLTRNPAFTGFAYVDESGTLWRLKSTELTKVDY